MQRGTCFINYEDFRECFTAYKKETKSSYSIESSVSVRSHNTKFNANIRPDVTFTEVKFGCSKLHGHNGKRKSQDIVCPAYFFLKYDMDLDRLVLKEVSLTHIHSKRTNPPRASVVYPPVPERCPSPDLKIPSKKICRNSLSLKKAEDLEEVRRDIPSSSDVKGILPVETQDTGEANSKPTSDVKPEGLSAEAVLRLDCLIKDFQKVDVGSKSSLTIGSQNQLEHLCFQTSSMSSWFLKFPECLLLHRVSSRHGYILYAFLVETKERMVKLVHFSFVTEDHAKNVSKMLELFKHFNPEWPKVKVIYTDVAFGHTDILKETFPSAKVLLSVYHTVHLIERKVKGRSSLKDWIHKWIDEAVYDPSCENLKFLAQKLEYNMDKDLYEKLSKEWFSNELLWYMHVKKGIHSCSTYMNSIALIDGRISSCVARQSSVENAVHEFLRSADCFNNKGLEKGRYPTFPMNASKAPPKKSSKKLRPILPALEAPPSGSKFSIELMKKAVNKTAILKTGAPLGPKLGTWKPVKLANKMLLSLAECCNGVGFQLCSRELDIVQKSGHLIDEKPNFTTVQILEDTHTVSLGGYSCTCYFNKEYKLPCRHILSFLHAGKRPVEENMVSIKWRKNYVKPILDSRVYGKVLHHSKSKAETSARVGMIKSLAKEFYNLLMPCDGPELQVRISMLQNIVDMWKNDSSDKKPCLSQDKPTELPYRWVPKEPTKGETSSGYELFILDP
ncbi:zinc finger SWIM domain-containing protein 3 [Leptodactylus fuscus]|uniref:zinc finger SWIM domain-containing protein 3 n=1 Tax=Leptodactylus fuscus TaxID=238119 RepID=UPI003F4E5644